MAVFGEKKKKKYESRIFLFGFFTKMFFTEVCFFRRKFCILSNDSNAALKKLNSALIFFRRCLSNFACGFNAWTLYWPDFIERICTAVKRLEPAYFLIFVAEVI